jgi:hypothetical protein
MYISKIYSTRQSNNEVYSHLIYEWEDDYSKYLEVPIYSYGSFKDKYLRYFFKIAQKLKVDSIIQKLEGFRKPKSYSFIFELYPRTYFSFQVFTNKIPHIIDFDYNVDLNTFYVVYKNCKVILISSLEAYNYLKLNKCPLNIVHQPLSISNNHKLSFKPVKEKEIDLIVVRANKVFTTYLEKFAERNPNFEYVERRWKNGLLYKNNVYFSNKRGALGEYSEREAYLELLRNSKVALYSTPGFDDNHKRFMNHVTPSLFEFISSGCQIIARYPKNYETDFFNLEKISPSISTYEEFEKLLNLYMNNESSHYLKQSTNFLDSVYTQNQVNKLKLILDNIDK